jgi:transcription elongation factor GreA
MADVKEVKKNLMTVEGLKKLEDELFDLKVNQRKANSEKIKEAREQGDLSENAEYDAAKDEQRHIEGRIEELETILKNAEVVVEEDVKGNELNVGCTVMLHDIEFDEDVEYKIVGSTEADSLRNFISNESPLGKALMHKKKGTVIEVDSPAGIVKYKIKSFHKTTDEEKKAD